MFALLCLVFLPIGAFADVVVYERGWVSQEPKVLQHSWYRVGKGRRGGSYVVEVDSYQTQTTAFGDSSGADTDRLLNWYPQFCTPYSFAAFSVDRAFQQLSSLAADGSNGKPVYLDVSVVERKTTTGPTAKSSTREFVMTNENHKETKKNDGRRTVLLALLFVSCVASWVLFFAQANKLLKRFRRRQQRKLKRAAKQNEMKVPLLEPEGAMK